LLFVEAVGPIAQYIWWHWTTVGIIHSATECVDQLPKLVDDMIAFREDHGNFPLSEDALKYLRLFPESHQTQVNILPTLGALAQTPTHFAGTRS